MILSWGYEKRGPQKYCTSCGSPIPDGQGNSCSMCYGDIAYGRDGYYERWAEDRNRYEEERREEERRQEREQEESE